jgi:hypothetical protein
MTHTKDILAEELRKVGLDAMADKAATGYYHDFLSPLATPEMQLCSDLLHEAHFNKPANSDAIMALRKRVIDGDFDASTEESEEWARSDEGRETFGRLIKR